MVALRMCGPSLGSRCQDYIMGEKLASSRLQTEMSRQTRSCGAGISVVKQR